MYAVLRDWLSLGELWLPWYVQLDNPDVVIEQIDDQYHSVRTLRVGDLASEPVRTALASPSTDRPDSSDHLSRIAYYRERFADAELVTEGPFVALRTFEGPLLTEGCHQACALFELRLAGFEFTIATETPEPGDPRILAARLS